jgi:hypothetical protein
VVVMLLRVLLRHNRNGFSANELPIQHDKPSHCRKVKQHRER